MGCEMIGINMSLSAFAILMFSVLFLAQTAPPVTGGSVSVTLLLLAQMNVPQELVAIYLSIDFFLEMMRTSINKTSAMNTVFDAAKQEGKLG